MSFNVMCSFCTPEGYDPWEERLPAFADVFARHDSDLIGLQELAFPPEVARLLADSSAYEAIWYQETAERGYPDATIFYRADRFSVLEQGAYWLSPTPEEPMSTGFARGGQLPRVVVWARLEDVVWGGDLVFATTHFDPNSPSQEKSAPLLLERTAPLAAAAPVIVTGDFNADPEDEAYRTLTAGVDGGGFALVDVHDIADVADTAANEDPAPAYDPAGRIDHIFVGGQGGWEVPRWTADLTTYGPQHRLPSDHRALAAELRLLRGHQPGGEL